MVEPELAYMLWGEKPKTKNKIYMSTTFYRVHDNEMNYHYWNKAFAINIDNVTFSNGTIMLSDKPIGTYSTSTAGGFNRYIISGSTNADIYLDRIAYYGMKFKGVRHSRNRDACNTHKSDLLTCVKTADPQINFMINRSSKTFVSYNLLSLYSDTMNDFIGNDTNGIFEWYIYFDCNDNAIKSYMVLKDINTENIIKQTDIITLCENYYNKDGEYKW